MEIIKSAMAHAWVSTWHIARETLLPQSDVDFHMIALCDANEAEKHSLLPLYRLNGSSHSNSLPQRCTHK